MKLSTETKFDIGQEVYIIMHGKVRRAIIKYISLQGTLTIGSYFPWYELAYDDKDNGWFLMCAEKREDSVYATKQEADAVRHTQEVGHMVEALTAFKHEARRIARRFRQRDCDNEAQQSAIRIVNRANDELAKLMKLL